MAKRNIWGLLAMLGMVAVTSSAKYCFCHVGVGLFPLVLEANGACSLHRDYKSMFLRESVAGGLERGGKEEKGGRGPGPIKIQMSACRCNSTQP